MIRIYVSKSKATLKAAVLVSTLLLCAVAMGFGQQPMVNMTAGPATTTMPDVTVIPMWGYSCGTAVSGSTATCAPLSGSSSLAGTGHWVVSTSLMAVQVIPMVPQSPLLLRPGTR
jgi:hypothetical protein